jgi:penicillin-binding protein 2
MPAFSRRDNPAGRRGRPIRTGRPDRPVIHPPSIAIRVTIIGGLALVLVAMIVFRLWFLQVLSAQQYVVEANDNRLRSVEVVAPRGSIVDRNGDVIVDNRPGLEVGIRPMDVPSGQLNDVIRRLSRVLGVPASAIRNKVIDHSGLVDPEGDPPVTRNDAFAAIDSHEASGGLDLVVAKEDASKRVVSNILEHKLSYPGIEVRKAYLRDYPQGNLAAHLLGYLGEISPEELKLPQYRKYDAGDVIGQGGVEETYDRWLRGTDGVQLVEVDVAGRPKRIVSGGRAPRPGDTLVTSLDSRVQRAAQDAIVYGIEMAHQNDAPSADAGAAVVLDVHTGEVIAMASYPSYDPTTFVGGISAKDMKALNRPSANTPQLDRADQGLYAIGSTFKPVDAIAGLQEGLIAPGTTFTCTGSFTPPEAHDEKVYDCWWPYGHGSLSLIPALAESCDVYFYNVGMLFYRAADTPLADWAMRLGFGHTTGLDIPGEEAGRVPTPDWKKDYYTKQTDPKGWQVDSIWNPGDSINLAIGQGNLLATPLQTAVVYSAIANGGSVVRPHLGVKVVDSQGDLVQRIDHPQPKKLDIAPYTLDVVKQGLVAAATSSIGTSDTVFGDYPKKIAGKTGTAEVWKDGRYVNYSWYASFAPADDPRYAVVVMIEQGGHGGTAAAPATRKIYDSLFHLHTGNAAGATQSD